MQQATFFNPQQRQQLGLLNLASDEDKARSVETTGEKTDQFRVVVSKVFNVPYSQVTPHMVQQYHHAQHRAQRPGFQWGGFTTGTGTRNF